MKLVKVYKREEHLLLKAPPRGFQTLKKFDPKKKRKKKTEKPISKNHTSKRHQPITCVKSQPNQKERNSSEKKKD